MEIYPMCGHSYGPDAWRMCACGQALPSHTDTAPDPAGGGGCGMAWRLCGRCDHIDERHVTEDHVIEVQPGGHLRQDVPAGLGLPNHHEDSEEKPMVELTHPEVAALSATTARVRAEQVIHDALFYEDEDGPIFKWHARRLVSDDDVLLKLAVGEVLDALLDAPAVLGALATREETATVDPLTDHPVAWAGGRR